MSFDVEKLNDYVDKFYVPYFKYFSLDERYKWHAIQEFRNYWGLVMQTENESEVAERLISTVNSLQNLLNGIYAKTRLIELANSKPLDTRRAFLILYNTGSENRSAIEGISEFERTMQSLVVDVRGSYSDLDGFSGARTATLLLLFMFPQKYYFYKSDEYTALKNIVGYQENKKLDKFQNCQHMSEELLSHLKTNEQFITPFVKLNKDFDNVDPEYHLAIQDLMWSTNYYDDYKKGQWPKSEPENPYEYVEYPKYVKPLFKAGGVKKTDYELIERKRRLLGLEGEEFVMSMERERLERRFPDDSSKRPFHFSKEKGDGAGFDIKSFDNDGKPIYIEVKTTTGPYDEPFFLTNTEVEISKEEKNKYYLYRVYNFKDGKGKIGVSKGSLERFCGFPTEYKVVLKK